MSRRLDTGARNAILLEEDISDIEMNGLLWETEEGYQGPRKLATGQAKLITAFSSASPSRILWLDES